MRSLKEIGELIRTQDNRITDQPMFIVQEKVRDYGFEPLYSDDYEWLDEEGCIADPDQAEELEKGEADGKLIINWTKTYYRERWEFVMGCFTEQGCEDFLKIDGHNHKETRIYAQGTYRNHEFQEVRKALMVEDLGDEYEYAEICQGCKHLTAPKCPDCTDGNDPCSGYEKKEVVA